VGIKGAIFMSGQWNIAPIQVPGAGNGGGRGAAPGGAAAANGPGSTCGAGAQNSSDGYLPGRAEGQPGGPNPAPAGGRGGGRGRGPVDPAVQLERSTWPDYQKTTVKIMLASAELDPGISDGKMSAFNQTFHDELCKLGPDHCPTLLFEKGESHMSEVFSIDTNDKTVSGPILAWIKKIK
jgi:hypothetical protein